MPTPYYDFKSSGEMMIVTEESRRRSCGLKYLSADRVKEYSDGKFTEGGWLVSDDVTGPTHFAKTDSLGIHGVRNPVDGKMYDSRAAYEKAVKAAGCVILGDDAPKELAKAKPKVKEN